MWAAWFAWGLYAGTPRFLALNMCAICGGITESYSCSTISVLERASYALTGIRGYLSQYLPRTIQSPAQFLVVAVVILFLATLIYGLTQSRKNELT
jgi:uncharacterized membrane protein